MTEMTPELSAHIRRIQDEIMMDAQTLANPSTELARVSENGLSLLSCAFRLTCERLEASKARCDRITEASMIVLTTASALEKNETLTVGAVTIVNPDEDDIETIVNGDIDR